MFVLSAPAGRRSIRAKAEADGNAVTSSHKHARFDPNRASEGIIHALRLSPYVGFSRISEHWNGTIEINLERHSNDIWTTRKPLM
jgi:hypothetical protein